MAKGDDSELPELGQVRLGEMCEHGYRSYAYVDPSGAIKQGTARHIRDGSDPVPPGDYEWKPGEGCTFSVRRSGASRTRPTSNAYRSGWDRAFGRHAGKAS